MPPHRILTHFRAYHLMYFIRTRSTETTTHTIHNYHGTHYYQPCPGII